MSKTRKELKRRNLLALVARAHTGAGDHGDRKKDASRKACRGKVDYE